MEFDSDDDVLRVSARVTDVSAGAPAVPHAAPRSFLGDVLVGLRHGVPTSMVMLALSAVIAHFAPFDRFDAYVMRLVQAQRTPAADELALGGARDLPRPIQQLEISSAVRVAKLDQKDAADEVERLQGVAPINRGVMADLLSQLAERLPVEGGNAPPTRVFAVDVDLAPLGAAATRDDEVTEMCKALDKLRARAHVVAIVLPRSDPDAAIRRDHFMAAQCTPLHADAKPVVPACGAAAAAAPKGGLYFASPRLFHQARQYAFEFPAREAGARSDPQRGWFPTLGNLMHLLRQPLPDEQAPAAKRSLTSMCEQARANSAEPKHRSPLLEDRLAVSPDPAEGYEKQLLNWRLLDSTAMRYTPIGSIEAISDKTLLDDAAFQSATLILSIDGGARQDKFDIAGISPEPVSGAALHSLQALSLEHPLKKDNPLAGLGVDLLVGLLFTFGWGFANPALRRWRERMPVVGGWVSAATPALLAWGVMSVAIMAAARFASADLWINPAYMVMGLALDAYLEGWRQEAKTRHPDGAYPDARRFGFGVDTAWSYLRQGFGDRTHELELGVQTQRSGFDMLARVKTPGKGPARMADVLVSMLVRIGVLVAGFAFMIWEVFKHWRGS